MSTFSEIFYMLLGYVKQINFKMSHATKINSKQVKDLNVRAKPMKLLKENIGVSLCNLGIWQFLKLDMIPKT